MTLSS
jgi:mRNA turnover protein 4